MAQILPKQMTFIQLLKTTGELPTRAITEGGQILELEVETKNGVTRAFLWQVIDGVQEHLFAYGVGADEKSAKDCLINRILHP
jgi:hypothetical protein